MNQVKVGRHRQVAGKLVVGLNTNRPHGDVRAAAQQVKQPHTELAREAFVDNLQRLEALAHHATLGIGIVGANVAIATCRLLFRALLAVAV